MTDQVNQDEFLDAFGAALTDSNNDSVPADQHTENNPSIVETANEPQENPAPVDGQQQNEPQDDPWQAVPEPLRKQFFDLQQNHERLQLDHRANAGRVAALNRKTQELADALKSREQAQGGADTSNKSMPTAAELQGRTFEEVEAEWPEVAALIKHQVQTTTQALQQQFQQQLAPLNELQQQYQSQQQEAYIQSELSRLAQQHPDYKEIAADPAFSRWIQTQPTTVQQMYGSTSADDNAALLTLFKAQTNRQSRAPAKQNNLADYATPSRKGTGAPTNTRVPDDGDLFSLFEHHLNEQKKRS